MAVETFTDGRVYAGGIDLSGHTNQGVLDLTAQELDISSIKAGWDTTIIGRRHVELNASGFWEGGAGKPDETFTLIGSTVVTTLGVGGDVGDVAYSFRGVPTHYTAFGEAGGVIPFSVKALGATGKAVRGTIAHADTTARTATGAGTARQLGAVLSTQTIYSALHVLSVSGTNPTLDVLVRSDAAEDMATPTTRLTHTQMTAAGGDWQQASGAVTDDWWRPSWTIGGTDTPTFTFAIVFAIQTT